MDVARSDFLDQDMVGILDDVDWTTPEYSKERVNAAGRTLIARGAAGWGLGKDQELDEALAIIGNWRAAHAYPLQAIKMTLLGRAKRIDPKSLVVQRLKRLPAIFLKLSAIPGMELSRMHDIGGCRAIVPDAACLKSLVSVYDQRKAQQPSRGPQLGRRYDYVSTPKPDGYRSVHFVCKYQTDSEAHAAHNDLNIEIQLRTRLQHAWATAFETVVIVTQQALRSTISGMPWGRFFSLMGTVIARREGLPPVPGTPSTRLDLVREIRTLARQLNVSVMLSGYQFAMRQSVSGATGAKVFLLVLDSKERRVHIKRFRLEDYSAADQEYMEVEKEIRGDHSKQAVLVSADSLADARRAYPNYRLDTKEFLALVSRARIGGI